MRLEIITLAVRIAFAVLAGILVPAAEKWLATKTENEKLNRAKGWAKVCVQAAEQLYNKVQKDDPDGTKRWNYASQALNRFAQKLGLALSDKEIEAMIESAVHELNEASAFFEDFDKYEEEENDGVENH